MKGQVEDRLTVERDENELEEEGTIKIIHIVLLITRVLCQLSVIVAQETWKKCVE